MKIKIAVPSTPLFKPLYENYEAVKEKFDADIYIVDEQKAADLFSSNIADIALLTPVGYGQSKFKADGVILPGLGLTAEGYTGIASIFFRKGLTTISSAASPYPEDFLMMIGNKIMAERYGIIAGLEKVPGEPNDILMQKEAAIVYSLDNYEEATLDVTEEWQLSFEQPLPICFWVIREENFNESIYPIIESLAAKEILESPEEFISAEEFRTGRLIWRFNKEFETAGDNLLEFLYFHQFFPEAPSIKFIGDDTEELPDSNNPK
jgi:hypothetical protein